jgi:hypothetical protein
MASLVLALWSPDMRRAEGEAASRVSLVVPARFDVAPSASSCARRLHIHTPVRGSPGAQPSPRTSSLHRLTIGSTLAGRLPRKEVIQPQLPLRLPCYDFVPITRPTLDGCLPEGLAHRLQVLPAFMT